MIYSMIQSTLLLRADSVSATFQTCIILIGYSRVSSEVTPPHSSLDLDRMVRTGQYVSSYENIHSATLQSSLRYITVVPSEDSG